MDIKAQRKQKRKFSTSKDENEKRIKNGDSSITQEDNLAMEKFQKDRLHLTDLERFFPEEVWKMVTDKVEKKDDVENCSNASLFFGKLLREKRLQQVWRILGQRFMDRRNEDESYKERNLECIPWNVRKDRSHYALISRMTGLFKCRHVCKSWNKAIENFFEFLQQAKNQFDSIFFKFGYYGFSRLPQEFLEHFKDSHFTSAVTTGVQAELIQVKNPFLGRRIIFLNDYSIDDQLVRAFYNASLEIGRKYGQEIWHLEFEDLEFADNSTEIHHRYKLLRELVQFMPNLKTLYVRYRTIGDYDFTALNLEIANNPLPTTAKLESIIILGDVEPAPFFREIVQRNLHISKLVITEDSRRDFPVLVGNFPNLRELNLNLWRVQDIEEFENYAFTLHLKKLTLTVSPFVSWSKIFRLLEANLDTELCTHLDLKLPEPEERKGYQNQL